MVSDPQQWVEPLSNAGADQITIHFEANIRNFEEISELIRSRGMRVGLAIKPKTEIDGQLLDLLDRQLFDLVLVMTVGK